MPASRLHWTDEQYMAFLKSRVLVDQNGCWMWQGSLSGKIVRGMGYGCTVYRGNQWRVHRLAYYLWRGPIAMGCDVCHTCDVRNCCNPDHLWAGANWENLHDASDKGRHHCQVKTHCPQGHPYDDENTRIVRTRSYTGVGRACRTCERERMKSPSYVAWRRAYQKQRRAAKRLSAASDSQHSGSTSSGESSG